MNMWLKADIVLIEKPSKSGFLKHNSRRIDAVIIHSVFNNSGGDLYNVDSIVEWFKDYIDKDDIIEAYGGVEEVTAKDIVDDIFCESDSWYDDFIQKFDIESDVVDIIDLLESFELKEAVENLRELKEKLY